MARDRRILILTHNYPRWPGDFAGVFLEELVGKFCSEGIYVHVLAPHFAGALSDERRGRLHIRRFHYAPQRFETLAYAGDMHKQVRSVGGLLKLCFYLTCNFCAAMTLVFKAKPDLIFAQWLAPSGMVGWLVSILTRRKLYITSHGTDVALLKKSGLLRLVGRVVYRRARKVFMVSSYLRETVLDLDVAAPTSIEVCPMPARTDVFGASKVVERRPPLVLCVARFTAQKQLDVLFRALKQVDNRGIEFVCEVYGEGVLKAEHLALIDSLGLSDQIFLRDPVDQKQLAEIYAAARVTVLPSIEEGFGLTLVEAQLSGSAVIGARSGGITDIILPDRTGLLFEPGNVGQLATQIAALLSDDDLHHQLVVNARRRAEQDFSPESISRKYQQALGLNPSS